MENNNNRKDYASVPLRSQLHTDAVLSNVAVKYINTRTIHQNVAPMVAVKKQSDLYRVYNRNFIIPETARAIGGLAREHQFEVSTATYSLQKEALKGYVPDTAVDNYDGADLRVDMTTELTEKIMMKKENDCAALFTTTAWSLGMSADADDQLNTSTGDIIRYYDTGTSVVVGNSGVKPNYSIVPLATYNAIKNHSTVVDRIKYTGRDYGQAILASLLGIGELLVPDMYVDSGLYGASAATGALASLWKTDFAWLGYKPAAAGPNALSSLYEFRRNKPMVRSWRDEEREAEAIEVDQEYTFRVVASLTGYYINDLI